MIFAKLGNMFSHNQEVKQINEFVTSPAVNKPAEVFPRSIKLNLFDGDTVRIDAEQ